ncbi:MAG: LPS export ABC transporter periplasmic protein LptC [Treponema sp.]|nr:LPS export ABC transporter periplasmic protein LptC [Treponema sp.]MCL2272095.1 LPS export ABC transporter periplasmic protein LptC [Treponema sp.]
MKKNITGFLFILILFAGCTFDYGGKGSEEDALPEIVMVNVEYVRVRSAGPLARIQAERFERYEKQSMMKMQEVTFEQYSENGEKVNIYGTAGRASLNIESGDIFMDDNVNLEIKSEDIILETYQLEWQDESKNLYSGENDDVFIFRENGTKFTGTGLHANTRTRMWEFLANARGVYVHDEKDTE